MPSTAHVAWLAFILDSDLQSVVCLQQCASIAAAAAAGIGTSDEGRSGMHYPRYILRIFQKSMRVVMRRWVRQSALCTTTFHKQTNMI